MKKILVYYDSMHRKGGIERVIANLFNNLVSYYDITILTCDEKKSSYKLDDRIEQVSMKRERTLNMTKGKFYRILQIISSLKYNHIFLKKILDNYDYVYVATPLTALEIFLLGKKAKEKLVISEHASYYACNFIYRIIRRIVYPRCYCISVPTKTDTEIYQKMKCNTVYIPHLTTFKAKEKKEKFNKIALNIGRFTRDKQQIELLKIWKILKDTSGLNQWKLKIVGDGELENALKDYIEINNLVDDVIIIRSTPQIENIYNEADLFLFTSKMEGFGMVLLEAMAFGLPCISYDCDSGPRDIIINNENGFLIPLFDKESFILKCNLLMNNSQKREAMSINALSTVKQWGNDDIIKKWIEVFGG